MDCGRYLSKYSHKKLNIITIIILFISCDIIHVKEVCIICPSFCLSRKPLRSGCYIYARREGRFFPLSIKGTSLIIFSSLFSLFFARRDLKNDDDTRPKGKKMYKTNYYFSGQKPVPIVM